MGLEGCRGMVGWLAGWSGWWTMVGVGRQLWMLHEAVVFRTGTRAVGFAGNGLQAVNLLGLSCWLSAQNASLHEWFVVGQPSRQDRFTITITIAQQSIGGSLASNHLPLQLPGDHAFPRIA